MCISTEMTRLRCTVAALLAAGVLGCTAAPNTPGTGVERSQHAPDVEEKLAEAEKLWAANRLANYDFSIHVVCFCFLPPILTFHVRDGESSAPSLDAATRARVTSFESIDALFALLREYLQQNPARFEVEYHPTLGHVTKADLDIAFDAADDELRIEIIDFQ